MMTTENLNIVDNSQNIIEVPEISEIAAANNVVEFKKTFLNKIKVKQEQVRKMAQIDENSMIISELIFDAMRELNIDFEERIDLTKDVNLIFESVISFLMKLEGFEHPLQEFCETMYEISDEDLI